MKGKACKLKKVKIFIAEIFYLGKVIERFHMTSRRPYWCTKNNETAAILVYQANPVGVEVLSYVNTSFCSNRFT